MGRDRRGEGLSRAEVDRQLPGGQGRHALSRGAADDGCDRSARRAVPRRQDDRAAAGGDEFGEADPAARGL